MIIAQELSDQKMYMFNNKGKIYKSYEADESFPSPLDDD